MANLTCVVLNASDKEFNETQAALLATNVPVYIFTDAGYTEVEKNTITCMAFLEPDPKDGR